MRGIEQEGEFLASYSPDKDVAEFENAWKDFEALGGNRDLTYEPHYEGSSVLHGPQGGVCSAHGSFSFVARPGHHMSPQPLSDGRYLPEELGLGFTLLAFGAEETDVESIERAARGLNIPLKVVQDSYAGGRQRYESRLILMRPDQFVVWVGDSAPEDASGVLRKVVGVV